MRRYAPRSVFGKALYDRRWFVLGWFVGLAFLAWFIGIFYETFGKSDVLSAQLKELPPALRSIAGQSDNFASVPGYFGAQIFGKTMPLIGAILGIMLGTSLANEEEKGTLQTLLSAPVSRTRVLIAKWSAAVLMLLIVVGGLKAGLFISLAQLNLSLDLWMLTQGLLNLFIFMVFFLSLTYATGAIFGKRSVAIAVGSIVAMSGYILNTMAAAVEALKPYDKLSAFYYYGSENVLERGITWINIGALAVASIILLIIAGIVFARRDITS